MPMRLELAMSVLRQTPFVLACLAVLFVALMRWQRHPKVSALATAGSVTLLLAALIALFWDMFYTRNPNAGSLRAAELVVVWSLPLLQTIGVVLLMWAVFTEREARTTEGEDDENDGL
jgi:hypothetical protein